ncbi:MAG: hypothetical protein H6R01_690 [Burkholderiaceae bacterium]|nr:hypothetical protein [Burkholderiaceae bacterium]
MKLLIWLALFGLVAAALLAKKSASKPRPTAPLRRKQFDSTGAELMVRCAHCGVHVPISEAVNDLGIEYCCEEHRGKPPVF